LILTKQLQTEHIIKEIRENSQAFCYPKYENMSTEYCGLK